MRKRNLLNKGSPLCFIVFAMVLVLMAPNNILAAQKTIELEELQIINGFNTDILAHSPMALLVPVKYVFRINARDPTDTKFKNFTDAAIYTDTGVKNFIEKAATAYKLIKPAVYFARSYLYTDTGHNTIPLSAGAAAINIASDIVKVKMRAWLEKADVIAVNMDATGYHPKIC